MLTPDADKKPKLDAELIMATVYGSTRKLFAETKETLLASLDFSNLEKKHSHKLEGLCQVHGKEGIVNGYPMLTAIIGAEGKRGIGYNKLFSYKIDFLSENVEIDTAIDTVRGSLPGHKFRWVADRGFDDIKKFQKMEENEDEFVVRVYHDRKVKAGDLEIKLSDLEKELKLVGELEAELTIQKKKQPVRVLLYAGQFELGDKKYWLEKAVVKGHNMEWLLITNVDLGQPENAKGIWISYRQRWSIEDFFNFAKQQFELEKFLLRKFESIKTMVALLMVALSFIHQEFYYDDEQPFALWVLELGGWCGRKSDRKGKRVFSWGIESLLNHLMVEEWCKKHGVTSDDIRRWFGQSLFDSWRANPNQRKNKKNSAL